MKCGQPTSLTFLPSLTQDKALKVEGERKIFWDWS